MEFSSSVVQPIHLINAQCTMHNFLPGCVFHTDEHRFGRIFYLLNLLNLRETLLPGCN